HRGHPVQCAPLIARAHRIVGSNWKLYMLKKDRAAYVLSQLQELYPNPPIPLDHKDAFTLLIAVLLSAQCTDARVNTVTPALFALADNARDMAQVPVAKIQEIIRPCGLSPQKSKSIS